MSRGKFIVIEGGDGAGKDTQCALLEAVLPQAHVLFVHDPRSTEIGTKLREILRFDTNLTYTSELFLHLAARVQLVAEKIKPALEKGMHVISNRFTPSTFAYQLYGREREALIPLLKEMTTFAVGDVSPDVMILLDCPPEVGLERAAKARAQDRFESEKLPFHERVRNGYLAHIQEYKNYQIVDATKSEEEVHRAIVEILKSNGVFPQ